MDPLTPRELDVSATAGPTRLALDVLRLLVGRGSNRRIPAGLVISEGTVKFHVNSILRKLRVSNRAEAVTRYLRLLGMREP